MGKSLSGASGGVIIMYSPGYYYTLAPELCCRQALSTREDIDL